MGDKLMQAARHILQVFSVWGVLGDKVCKVLTGQVTGRAMDSSRDDDMSA